MEDENRLLLQAFHAQAGNFPEMLFITSSDQDAVVEEEGVCGHLKIILGEKDSLFSQCGIEPAVMLRHFGMEQFEGCGLPYSFQQASPECRALGGIGQINANQGLGPYDGGENEIFVAKGKAISCYALLFKGDQSGGVDYEPHGFSSG